MFETTKRLASTLGQPPDLVIRPVSAVAIELVYFATLVEADRVEERVLGRLLKAESAYNDAGKLLDWLQQQLWVGSVKQAASPTEASQAVTDGKAVLCTAGEGYYVADVQGSEHRPPEEPTTEAVIRGAREGFTETLQTNLSLIRVRLRDPSLRVDEVRLGSRTRTKVVLVYHADLVSQGVLAEVRKRMGSFQSDSILSSGQLEEWIEDTPWSPYPQTQTTERPDKVVPALLDGRVAILVDGTPFVLLVPAVLAAFLQSPEDYNQRWIAGTMLRFVRFGAMAISTLAPSLYVATTRFNPELMPLKLTLSLAASREGIPFPIIVEALLMEAMVELLREAGTRMPKPMGGALGIVGGLVIGDIAVKAGIVSPIMVIVVGLTALGSFSIPSYEMALTTRILRFPMVIITGLFGITGMLGFMLLVWAHLCNLRSFGVPYLTPIAQLAYREWRDTLIRAPIRSLLHRSGTYRGRLGQRAETGQGRDPTSTR